jgi:hypothetical protein
VVSATPKVPAAGEPTYDETIQWLATHMVGHSNYTTVVQRRTASHEERIQPFDRPCVLMVVHDAKVGTKTVRFTKYLSLSQADLARIDACRIAAGAPL